MEKEEDGERPVGQETRQRWCNICGEEKPGQQGYIYFLGFKTHGLGQPQ